MDATIRKQLMDGGIDVDGLLERCMGSEMLLARLLKKFPADTSYARLAEAVEHGDESVALEASHTLKGVCGNLSMTALFALLARQVAALRGHDMTAAASMMPDVSRKYDDAVLAIRTSFE